MYTLSPEERKAYKHGDCIAYDKEHSRYDGWVPASGETNCKCAWCGDAFYSRNRSRKYCSYRCANDAYMQRRSERKQAERVKICPVCGETFTGKTKSTVYCSAACKQKHYRDTKRAESVTETSSGQLTQTENSNVTEISSAEISQTENRNKEKKRQLIAMPREYDLSSEYDGLPITETRYVLVDKETGEVVDDAQGCGYKTAKGAHKAYGWKQTHKRHKKR